MEGKKIRKLLISYLQDRNSEIRIFEETNIGESICNVMSVTDCITGYKILDAKDNYSDIKKDIEEYSRYFEYNYLVTNKVLKKNIIDNLPLTWGIIHINRSGVSVNREAVKGGGDFSVTKQLSLLWKEELQHIAALENITTHLNDSKEIVVERIAEKLQSEKLNKNIIYELIHRDYKKFKADDYSVSTAGIENENSLYVKKVTPEEIVSSLSKQNLDELTLDNWIGIYRRARELNKNKEKNYKNDERVPTLYHIPYTEIEAVPGVPWIEPGIISEFICYLCTGMELWKIAGGIMEVPKVNYSPLTGIWFIEGKNKLANIYEKRLCYDYGLDYYNALYILEGMMNLRSVKREKEKETVEILEKQGKIKYLFQKWLWKDEDRRWKLEKKYNDMFRNFMPKQYDGTNIIFPGMADDIELYPYQKDAVQRIMEERNTLLAFDVGSGKTYIMIATAMKLRQMGISKKNMFVVPNNIVGQWAAIFKRMYPDANILTIDPKNFLPEVRNKRIREIRDGDYDGIIIAYSCFDLIPLSGYHIIKNMEEILEEIEFENCETSYATGISFALEKERKRIVKQYEDLKKTYSSTEFGICFEDLGISTLFLDEAHNFKNIPIRTNMFNINGINRKGSDKCLSMLYRVRYIQKSPEGRGVVFATGTPLSNSITDAYSMQMYLQYEKIKNMNLDVFDNWAKSFAQPERVCEIDVDVSKYRFVYRFSKFYNIPELARMFADISIFHAMDKEDGLPTMESYDDIMVNCSKSFKDYMLSLCERTDKIRYEDNDPRKDNMLKVTTDGRKAALDLRLVGAAQNYDGTSKLFHCVENVLLLYSRYKKCSQIIFCDYSTPKKREFNVYDELKKLFVSKGVPEKEIAFIHSYHTEDQKTELYKKVNDGKIRILIGSTFKLGIGANVQTRLKAIHHLDIPWRPADMVQREGRILRKGNTNSYVRIFRYILEGSFDAYSWQLLETKQKFISQFLSGASYQRTVADLETNVLTYAQVKALALSEPMLKELTEKKNELSRLQILYSNEDATKEKLLSDISGIEKEISETESQYISAVKNAEYLLSLSEEDFSMSYSELKKYFLGKTACEIKILDFKINIVRSVIYLEREGGTYLIDMVKTETGNAKKVINYLKNMTELPQQLNNKKVALENRKEEYQQIVDKPSEYAWEVEKAKREVDKLLRKMDKDTWKI